MQQLLSRLWRRKPQPGAGASAPLRPVAPAARKDPVQESAPAGDGLFSHSPWYGTPSAAPEASECSSSTYESDSSGSCDSGSSSGSDD